MRFELAQNRSPEKREEYVRRHAPDLLGAVDPELRRARIGVVSFRHREDVTDVILLVRRRDNGSDEQPFQVGFTLRFTATDQGTAPAPPDAFYRRGSAGQKWQSFAPVVTPDLPPAAEPIAATHAAHPLYGPLFSPATGRILAAILIIIGLYASFSPLADVVMGVRSHSWPLAALTGTANGWSFTNPADGSTVELYERRLNVARERRKQEQYAACFHGIGYWLLFRETPQFVRINPDNPVRSVLANGIPPESAGLLLLSMSLLFAGIRLWIDIRTAAGSGTPSLKQYYFSGTPPPFISILLVHLGMFGLYVLAAISWSHLIPARMPGFPALVLLAVMGYVELKPGLWSWLYSFPRVRWLLLQLLLLALLPLGVAIAGLGLPFALAILTGFLLLAVAGSLFAPAYLPQNLTRLVWMPVYLAGIGAAFRSLALLAYILMPVARIPYHKPAELLGDITWVARFDVAVGIAGVVVVLGSTILDTFWRLRQVRQLENLPTSRAASAAMGIAEFSGIARSLPDSSGPILYFEGAGTPVTRQFYLEDESGRILVDPSGAVFRSGRATSLMGRINEIVLTKRLVPAQINRPMSVQLHDGDPVYLIGNVMSDDRGGRVVKPLAEPGVNGPFLRLMLGKTSLPPARDIQHVFFLSDTDETIARRHITAGINEIWFKAAVGVLLSLFLISYQLPRASAGNAHWTLSEALEARLEPIPRLEMITGYLLGENDMYLNSRRLWLRELFYAADLLKVKEMRENTDAGNYLWGTVRDTRYRSAAPLLAKLARNAADRPLRRYAVWALGKIGAPPVTALPVLLEALSGQDGEIRATAATALPGVVPEARSDSVAALLAATADSEPAVVIAALWALRSTRGLTADNGLLERVTPLLGHQEKQVRHEAANVLAHLGSSALPALPELRAAVQDQESMVRNSAVVAIGNIGPEAAAAVPDLVRALHDKNDGTRQFAATALGRIGKAAGEALPDLRAALDDKGTWVKKEAASAIKRIESGLQ